MECVYLMYHCRACDLEIFEPLVSGVFSLSKVETHMLSVRFETLTRYPNARSPSNGVLIGLDDANLTCTVTIANANDLANDEYASFTNY